MAERHKIRSFNKSAASNPSDQTEETALLLDDGQALAEEWAEPEKAGKSAPGPSASLWPLLLALLFAAGWTGFYGWALYPDATRLAADPRDIADVIAEWAVPILLIGVFWLIAMRHSRAEAGRFANSGAVVGWGGEAIEARLITVNRELSLAREFLAAQSQELDSLGRIAADRIARHASELQELIKHNGAEVSAIATTSETALGNMNLLRDNLPVVANSARDATNQIGNAGRTASEQLEKLITAFERLNQFGTASAAQVTSLEAIVDQTLGTFEDQVARIEAVVTDRFATLQADVTASREQVTALEEQALAVLKRRIVDLEADLSNRILSVEAMDQKALANAQDRIAALVADAERFDAAVSQRAQGFAEQIAHRQAAFDTHEALASEALDRRLAELDDALARRREAQITETERLVAHSADLAGQLDALGELIGRIQLAGQGARAELGEGLGGLGDLLGAKQRALAETQDQLAALTETSVRLLEIIQSGARFTREDLAGSITAASEQLEDAQAKAGAVHGLMIQSTEQGERLDAYLVETREQITGAAGAIRDLETMFAAQSEDALARLQGLRGGFARLAEDSGTLAAESQERLCEALGAIDQAIAASIDSLDEAARGKLGNLAATLGEDAVAALERSMRNEAAVTIGKLEQAASHASGVGREATVQLRDQLAMVNELTGNLEQRINRARELAEEQVNNDFARRMALITDSLNSASIDLTSALSTEVSDTAWEAYLKGDRGIFTRRALRLIDNRTARAIAEMYQRDDAFKANVSRYIHDFEAMLRSILSTRSGNALSVTILGSDMGKLYVALAQAIQRLRT
jgi:hypothetical protein